MMSYIDLNYSGNLVITGHRLRIGSLLIPKYHNNISFELVCLPAKQ